MKHSQSLENLAAITALIESVVQSIKQSNVYPADTHQIPVAKQPATFDTMTLLDFSQKCFEVVEISQRWIAIGIEDWIKAGRWWLLRVPRHDPQSWHD